MRKDFEIGDRITLIKADGLAADTGAQAFVRGYHPRDPLGLVSSIDPFVIVEWIRDTPKLKALAKSQSDGGYDQYTFIKFIESDWDM